VQITFTTRRETCPPVILNGHRILQADNAKYLGLHLNIADQIGKNIYIYIDVYIYRCIYI